MKMVESNTVTTALRSGAAWAAYTGADWLAEHLMGVIKEIDKPQGTVASQEQEEGKDGKAVLQGEPLAQPSCTT